MFQKLFLPAAFYKIFVKKQGKSLMTTKFYRGSSLLRKYLDSRDQQNPVAQDIRQSVEQRLL